MEKCNHSGCLKALPFEEKKVKRENHSGPAQSECNNNFYLNFSLTFGKKNKNKPAAASEIEVEETSDTLSSPGQEGHQLDDRIPLRYFRPLLGRFLFRLHFLYGCEECSQLLPYSLLVKVHPVWAAAAVVQPTGDTVGYLNQEQSCRVKSVVIMIIMWCIYLKCYIK